MNNHYKYIIIDNRMRKIEKDYLKSLGYKLIELPKNDSVYEEISSHTDIFVFKIDNTIISEPSVYDLLNKKIISVIKGEKIVESKYPLDIPYNVCIIGNYAIHNFKYTSKKVIEILIDKGYININTKQGYTNCSIAVIDDNSIIINDKGLYKELSKFNFNILYIEDELDIKLLCNNKYSKKRGFIGGCITRVDNKIIVFGDLNKIDAHGKIRKFIQSRKLQIIDFKTLDVIDYGGVVVI